MGYTFKVKDKAFSLYCEGKSTREVARGVKVKDEHTIISWIKKLGWEERRRKINAEAAQKADKAAAVDIAERLIEHDRAARALKGGALKALRRETEVENPDPDKLAAISRALKTAIYLERQALGLPTELLRSEHTGVDGGAVEVVVIPPENYRRKFKPE